MHFNRFFLFLFNHKCSYSIYLFLYIENPMSERNTWAMGGRTCMHLAAAETFSMHFKVFVLIVVL